MPIIKNLIYYAARRAMNDEKLRQKATETFEKEIKFTKKFVLPLSEGKWEVVDRYAFHYYFSFKGNIIARLENNELMELLIVEKADLSGEAMAALDHIVQELVFKEN